MMSPDPQPHVPWPTYRFDGWIYVRARYELTNPDAEMVALTSGEHDMLQVFLEHPQRILSRDFLYNHSPRQKPEGRLCTMDELRTVDVAVTRLRRKIEPSPHFPSMIKTIRFRGYYFAPRPEILRDHPPGLAPDAAIVDQ